MSTQLSIRVQPGNPNHHLWNNNGTWWCHFTVHLPDYTKRRVRLSLQTADRQAACRQRDALLTGHAYASRLPGPSF